MKKLLARMGRKWYLPIAAVVWDELIYYGANLIARDWPHFVWELNLDRAIPFLPWTVSIYFACFLFWAASYILYAAQENDFAYRFFLADFMSKGVCLIFFLLLPTTNLRPEVLGTGVWDHLMRFLYWIDEPANLFPSIHCMCSWLCYIGARENPKLPVWWRRFTLVSAIVICASTLTTKQHVVVDVIGGVALAELSFQAAKRLYPFREKKALS